VIQVDPVIVQLVQPQAGQWGGWSLWGKCSVKCGQGTKLRHRLCLSQGRFSLTGCDGKSSMNTTCSLASCTGKHRQLYI